MQVGSEPWNALIIDGAARMGITVTPRQAGQMARHAGILLDWNRKINLTAITGAEEVAIKHFLDAILPLPHIPDEGALLDLGTGGGFPGIPLKVMRPRQSMTLIDASRKKINFVKHLIRQLSLPGIEAVQTRVEIFARQKDQQGRFRVIVSRAFADLNQIAQAATPLLAPRGRIIVYQGPGDDENRRPGEGMQIGPLAVLEVFPYQLPITGDRRALVVMG